MLAPTTQAEPPAPTESAVGLAQPWGMVLEQYLGPLTKGADQAPATNEVGNPLPAATGAAAPTNKPAPPVEQHLIPLAPAAEVSAVQVDNTDGLVRLVVRDAPLRQVLALLAESQKFNIVFANASLASVRVTVALDRVPLEVVLDAILSSCGHTWHRRGDIVYVSAMTNEQMVSPTVQGRHLQVFSLDYALALDVDSAVKGLLSPVGKSWVLQRSSEDNRRTREVVAVEDLPEYLERIADFIGQIDQPPRQVLVEVQVLEVDLNDARRNGVNFQELGNLAGAGIRFRSRGMADPASTQAYYVDIEGGDLTALVELLETTTDAKKLASPKLLAVNGQQSRLQIGERIPYRVTTTTETSSLESVEFLEVGVVLTFTPWITQDGRVLMRIAPKVSSGALNQVSGLPEEATTEVETDAFLADGQGIVIGGLISEQDRIDHSKFPGLGDLPYVGGLFQRRTEDRRRTETIVALMPHVLPYDCPRYQQNELEVQRARDPLTYGALQRFPRPYEPRMPDAVEATRAQARCATEAAGQTWTWGRPSAPEPAPQEPLSTSCGDPLAAQHRIRRLPPVTDQWNYEGYSPQAMPMTARNVAPTAPYRR